MQPVGEVPIQAMMGIITEDSSHGQGSLNLRSGWLGGLGIDRDRMSLCSTFLLFLFVYWIVALSFLYFFEYHTWSASIDRKQVDNTRDI